MFFLAHSMSFFHIKRVVTLMKRRYINGSVMLCYASAGQIGFLFTRHRACIYTDFHD